MNFVSQFHLGGRYCVLFVGIDRREGPSMQLSTGSLVSKTIGLSIVLIGLSVVLPASSPVQAQQYFQVPDAFPVPTCLDNFDDQDIGKFNREVLEKHGIALVEFMSPTCLVCNPTARLLNELTAKYHGKVNWLRFDVNKNVGLSYKYDIPFVPAVLVFKDGHLVRKFAVFKESQKPQLAETLDKLQL
jgi:thiol-disulfide isomerase/thioredoxin